MREWQTSRRRSIDSCSGKSALPTIDVLISLLVSRIVSACTLLSTAKGLDEVSRSRTSRLTVRCVRTDGQQVLYQQAFVNPNFVWIARQLIRVCLAGDYCFLRKGQQVSNQQTDSPECECMLWKWPAGSKPAGIMTRITIETIGRADVRVVGSQRNQLSSLWAWLVSPLSPVHVNSCVIMCWIDRCSSIEYAI